MHKAPPDIKRRNRVIIAIVAMIVVLFSIVVVSGRPRVELVAAEWYAVKGDATPMFRDADGHLWEVPILTNQAEAGTSILMEVYKDNIQRVWVEATETVNLGE